MSFVQTLSFDLFIDGHHARDLISNSEEINNLKNFLDSGYFYKTTEPLDSRDEVFIINGDFYKWDNKMHLLLLISSDSFKNSKKLVINETNSFKYKNELSITLSFIAIFLLIFNLNKYTFSISTVLFILNYIIYKK